MPSTPAQFGRACDRIKLSDADKLTLFHALPEGVQRRFWERMRVQIADRRYVNGDGPFVCFRPKQKPRKYSVRLPDDGWQRGTEALASIPAETYLAVLVPESDPGRGKCRCPLPDHEDRNPSASYKDSVWYCHRCAEGGGIFRLGSALTGLGDRGDQFADLRKWLAERLLGVPS